MAKYDVVVVGAGNAGLSAAIQTAMAGKKVLLIEQHNLPGGCATSFRRGRFEIEPSLHELCDVGPLDNPGDVRNIMDLYGIKVDWVRVPDCFRVITKGSDGAPLDVTMPSTIEAFIDQMEVEVPGSRPKMVELFELFQEVLDGIAYISASSGHADSNVLKEKYPNMLRTGAYCTQKVFDALKLPKKCQDILSTYWSYLGVDEGQMLHIHAQIRPVGGQDVLALLRQFQGVKHLLGAVSAGAEHVGILFLQHVGIGMAGRGGDISDTVQNLLKQLKELFHLGAAAGDFNFHLIDEGLDGRRHRHIQHLAVTALGDDAEAVRHANPIHLNAVEIHNIADITGIIQRTDVAQFVERRLDFKAASAEAGGAATGEIMLLNQQDFLACHCCLDRRGQTSITCTNDDHIVFRHRYASLKIYLVVKPIYV